MNLERVGGETQAFSPEHIPIWVKSWAKAEVSLMGYFLLNASALSSTLCLQFEICRITITWVLKVWVQNYSSIHFHEDIPIELVSQESIYSFLMYATQ